jgi:predicted SAM-dependent methyltransferase
MARYLNIGCGIHYSSAPEWTNLDFSSKDKNVITHNLLKGIPFEDNTFDLVYHSAVLEHFSKKDGEQLIRECHRVLKPGGILRVAIPDLEVIARLYLQNLERCWNAPEDESNDFKYQWILMEMYDQCVRDESGGEMKTLLSKPEASGSAFIRERIGIEFDDILENIRHSGVKPKGWSGKLRSMLRKVYHKVFHYRNKYEKLGRFRLGGEIHQWMYDKYSIRKLLTENGFIDFEIATAFTGKLPHWSTYNLDSLDGVIRKPDLLIVEAVRDPHSAG